MEFWLIFDIAICCLGILANFLSQTMQKNIVYFMLFILMFFSGFRYQIGEDYSGYVNIFSNIDFSIYNFYPEYSFQIISIILRENGFNAQALFFVYAFTSLIIFYFGIKYYLKDYKKIACALAFFTISIFTGYWRSMNIIRQFLSICIFLYASRYIFERKIFQYFLLWIIAVFFHYSAVFLLIVYWFPKIFCKKIVYFFSVLFAALCSCLHVEKIIFYVMDISGYASFYSDKSSYMSSGLGVFLSLFLYFFTIILIDFNKTNKKTLFVASMYMYGMVFKMIFVFILGLSRMAEYFLIFEFVFMVEVLYGLKLKMYKKIAFIMFVLFCLIGIQLEYLSQIPNNTRLKLDSRISSSNIEWESNFDIFW